MNENLHIVVLIMAAGASRRMKGIKQLLPWKNSNFLLETIRTVKESNADSVYVVLGANAETIMSECNLQEKDTKIFLNPNWSLGLGNSITFGVKKLIESSSLPDGILICLADQPLLSTTYLDSLISNFKKDSSKIIATKYKNRVGVPALFPKLLYPKLVLLEGDQGAKELLNVSYDEMVQLEPGLQSIDIDTKLEYNQLIQETNLKNED
ncbi:nucleotidyltransferase family protein [Maribacter arcticus]|uniref:nucleotidyltransferase family protein n=1 Tax=Maribacter arcticus TaxID=561365 RepID=UPI003002EF55